MDSKLKNAVDASPTRPVARTGADPARAFLRAILARLPVDTVREVAHAAVDAAIDAAVEPARRSPIRAPMTAGEPVDELAERRADVALRRRGLI